MQDKVLIFLIYIEIIFTSLDIQVFKNEMFYWEENKNLFCKEINAIKKQKNKKLWSLSSLRKFTLTKIEVLTPAISMHNGRLNCL
jgi:hypothetical protein